eukprot:1160002-Pelagomonas_calceolata.AAC.15
MCGASTIRHKQARECRSQANAGRVELTALDGASPIMLKPVPVKGEKGGAAASKYELPGPASALGTTAPPRAIARYLEATTGAGPPQGGMTKRGSTERDEHEERGASTCMCLEDTLQMHAQLPVSKASRNQGGADGAGFHTP